MQEIISCPNCQRKLQVPDSLLGQDVQCPTCNATFVAAAGGQVTPSTSGPPKLPGRELVPAEDGGRKKRAEEDLDEDYDDDRRRRRRRRDLEPHRGTMILVLGILSLVVAH